MTARGIVVATMTLVRDAGEQDVLLRSLSALSALGLPIVATDGGSPPAFLDAIRPLPHVDVRTNDDAPGLVGQVRTSFAHARSSGASRILYTEPDKDMFFRGRLVAFLERAAREPDAAVVLASRTRESFSSFPRSQQYAEGVLNDICASLTGLETDYSYGPFLMDAAVADLLEGLSPTIGWGWRPYVFLRAHRLGRRVARVIDDFRCPDDQQTDDANERRHRLRQLAQNLSGVAAALE